MVTWQSERNSSASPRLKSPPTNGTSTFRRLAGTRKLGPVHGQSLVTEHRAGYQFRPLTS